MGIAVVGDVVVVPFPFSDLSGAKRRPALVLAELDGDDLILCQITSVARQDGYSIPLTSADFAHGQLPRPSFIRPNRLFTADGAIVVSRVGSLSPPKLAEVRAGLARILGTA